MNNFSRQIHRLSSFSPKKLKPTTLKQAKDQNGQFLQAVVLAYCSLLFFEESRYFVLRLVN